MQQLLEIEQFLGVVLVHGLHSFFLSILETDYPEMLGMIRDLMDRLV